MTKLKYLSLFRYQKNNYFSKKWRFYYMDDNELLMIYRHSLLNKYHQYKLSNGNSFHPSLEHHRVEIPVSTALKRYFIYSLHEMTLLKEIWRRCNESFYQYAWWHSKKVLQTKIVYKHEINRKLSEVKRIFKNESNIKIHKSDDFIIHNNKKHYFYASGSKRKAYISPDKSYIIKVPFNVTRLGLEENLEEFNIYSNSKEYIYAKCELIENNWLKMEYVEPATLSINDDCPDWVSTIAETQVGYNRDGKLLAYDYGSKI